MTNFQCINCGKDTNNLNKQGICTECELGLHQMTGKEFKIALINLGLHREEFAKLINRSLFTVNKYSNGMLRVPSFVADKIKELQTINSNYDTDFTIKGRKK